MPPGNVGGAETGRDLIRKKRGSHSWPPPVFLLITCFRNASLHPLRHSCVRPMLPAVVYPYRASLPHLNIGRGSEDASAEMRAEFRILLLYFMNL